MKDFSFVSLFQEPKTQELQYKYIFFWLTEKHDKWYKDYMIYYFENAIISCIITIFL